MTPFEWAVLILLVLIFIQCRRIIGGNAIIARNQATIADLIVREFRILHRKDDH